MNILFSYPSKKEKKKEYLVFFIKYDNAILFISFLVRFISMKVLS